MVHDFAELKPTPEVIEKEFKMKPEEFDQQFLAWLDAQTKRTVDGFDEWKKTASRLLTANAKAKKWDDVISEGTRDSRSVSRLRRGRQRLRISVGRLSGQGRQSESDGGAGALQQDRRPQSGHAEAAGELEADAGQKKEAAATLERLNLIYPKDEEAAQEAGRAVYGPAEIRHGAVREFQARARACRPWMSRARIMSWRARCKPSNRTGGSADEVLSALEAAPGFKPAQKLLLELNVKE